MRRSIIRCGFTCSVPRLGGDVGPNSDYDLMVIVPEDALPQLQSEDLAYRALRGTGTAADVLVWTRSDFDRQLHLKASLPSTILREGRLL